jgi:formate hydrogenlyase subunit 6/NADH:ubiquinone oxidoreductase subunit I
MARKIHVPQMFERVVSYLFTEPATTTYPFTKPQLSDNFRGQPAFDIKLCINCGLCSKECPARAIEMIEVNGKRYPQFRLDRCIFCFHCSESCPRNAIKSSSCFELATTDKLSLIMTPQLSV